MKAKRMGGAGIKTATIALSDCVPHRRNYNQHPQSQIDDLAGSLQEFGQVKPIVVQGDKRGKAFTIVAGHGVALAAQQLGWTRIEAKILPATWSPTKVLAYLAADNELAKAGNPDEAQLAQIVKEIAEKEGDALARLAAGSEKALKALIAEANRQEEPEERVGELLDKAAELQKKWKVKKGDLFVIASKTAGTQKYVVCPKCKAEVNV